MYAEQPLDAAYHATSDQPRALVAVESVVPPTAMTLDITAGKLRRAESEIAARSDDCRSGMPVVLLVLLHAVELCDPIAVGDRINALRSRCVLRFPEIEDGLRGGLDEDDVTAWAGGGNHIQIQRDLNAPARIGRRIVSGLARLVELAEATVRRGARREPVRLPVHREISGRGRDRRRRPPRRWSARRPG